MDLRKDVCSICGKDDESEKLIQVTKKGLATLIEFAKFFSNNKLLEHFCSMDYVKVHHSCRRDFTNRRRTLPSEETEETMNTKKVKRSHTKTFDWKTDCFFCGKSAYGQNEHNRRDDIHIVSTLPFRNNVLETCKQRKDAWAIEVELRLNDCIDLVAVEAVYHKQCHTKFMCGKPLESSVGYVGRPEDAHLKNSFRDLCVWLETEAYAELYTVTELQKKMLELANGAGAYSTRYLKIKLEEHFRQHIYFAQMEGKHDIVCFREMANFIINKTWYSDKKESIKEEAQRIVETAAKIIRSDIRDMVFDMDSYPGEEEIKSSEKGLEYLPLTLKLLLKYIIPSVLKQVSIGQCIVKAAKPRTSLPPVMLGLGVEMDHMFGSKWLVKELDRLGFSVSYDEVTRYRKSIVQSEKIEDLLPEAFPGSFSQWVADNVDHNVATLDGHGTFHGMGIIVVSTPASNTENVQIKKAIQRKAIKKSPSLIDKRGIPILTYHMPNKRALCSLTLKPIIELEHPFIMPESTLSETIWHSGSMFAELFEKRPNWSGFMQSLSHGIYPCTSEITFLPIIDLKSSDESCIYSTLMFIESQAKLLNIVTPCITFDQPLWLKAVEVIHSKELNIVCRLGGFHMMMSFLGSVGTLMAGSGLSDLLETVYGPSTVVQMMSGKAVARSLRGHFLTEAALMCKIIKDIIPREIPVTATIDIKSDEIYSESAISSGVTESQGTCVIEQNDLEQIHENVKGLLDGTIILDQALSCKSFVNLQDAIQIKKTNLSICSRTAKLWLQYMEYIFILKCFIRAERTGDWHMHLVMVKKMLNLFAATGHNNYAKSSRLYLQLMLELPTSHPWLYHQFMNGNHAVRRSDRYWSGLPTDLAIEQILMRTIKTRGGLTQGRGFTESVRILWVYTIHKCSSIHSAMSEFTEHRLATSEQHVEMGRTRIKRDHLDVVKIISWLNNHDPFEMENPNFRSLASGLTSNENDGINCDNAEDVGNNIHKKMDNKLFDEVTLKRSDQIKSLSELEQGIKVDSESIHIDPMLLFSRLIIQVERLESMNEYFAFELAQIPTSLFKDNAMRKANKSSLASLLIKDVPINLDLLNGTHKVIDGGALIHRVVWKSKVTYSYIIGQYSKYVMDHYGMSTIVFDGYGHGPSTKDHEHSRRSHKASANITLSSHMIVHGTQQSFLSNDVNKSQFIDLLVHALKDDGHDVYQSEGDADNMIVQKALQSSSTGKSTVVVSDDTDVLVLLIHHFNIEMSDIFFLSEASKRSKMGIRFFSISDILKNIGNIVKRHILFIHAWTGCDTTSATFGQGKGAIINKLKNSDEVQSFSDIFLSSKATPEEISTVGQKLFVILYNGKQNETLNNVRYARYMNLVATSKKMIRPEMLPPTERSAHFHSLRVHLQILHWKDITNSQNFQAMNWGWKEEKSKLVPIMTDKEPAPSHLLKIIRCKCKLKCSSMCSCRKNGLKCVKACFHCQGENCNNKEAIELSDDSTNLFEEIEEEKEDPSEDSLTNENIIEIFDL